MSTEGRMTPAAPGSAILNARPLLVETLHTEERTPLDYHQVLKELQDYGATIAGRDALFVRARRARIAEVKIAELTGHSRNTVRKVLAEMRQAGKLKD